jgi:hypothetical protein
VSITQVTQIPVVLHSTPPPPASLKTAFSFNLMVNEEDIIDLTISSDSIVMIPTDERVQASRGPDKSTSGLPRKSRNKKSKTGRIQSNAATTREQSVEDGEITIKGAAGGIGESAPASSREQKRPDKCRDRSPHPSTLQLNYFQTTKKKICSMSMFCPHL